MRPKEVGIVGWFWIAIGGLMLFGATFAFLISLITRYGREAHATAHPGNTTTLQAVVIFVFDHFSLFALLQMSVAAFIIYSAIMFLRLKSWARASLEAFNWAALFVLITSVAWFGIAEWSATDPFRAFEAVICVIAILVYAAPLAVLLVLLRKGTVREACNQ